MMKTTAVAMALFGIAAFAAEKDSWAGFKPGSWTKVRSTSVTGKETNVSETKVTLVEKTANKIVIENELTTKGQVTKTRAELPVGGDEPAPPGAKIGTETITIAGKTLKCTTTEVDMDLGGTKVHSKSWTSEQVPGALVKAITTTKGSQSTVELVDFVSK